MRPPRIFAVLLVAALAGWPGPSLAVIVETTYNCQGVARAAPDLNQFFNGHGFKNDVDVDPDHIFKQIEVSHSFLKVASGGYGSAEAEGSLFASAGFGNLK